MTNNNNNDEGRRFKGLYVSRRHIKCSNMGPNLRLLWEKKHTDSDATHRRGIIHHIRDVPKLPNPSALPVPQWILRRRSRNIDLLLPRRILPGTQTIEERVHPRVLLHPLMGPAAP